MTTPTETRFKFGQNWQQYSKSVNPERIAVAEQSILQSLGKNSLEGLRFLDIGSGSGLFSLAARRLGATVHSFDFDEQSVACTLALQKQFYPNDNQWQIERGSVLDEAYLKKLGSFDIIYSWGVLHHTGNMFQAFSNVSALVNQDGYLFISIYNDQGLKSRLWTKVKRIYNESNRGVQGSIIGLSFILLWGPIFVRDFLKFGNPFKHWKSYGKNRGMSAYYDLVDWVGGYPFEVAKPEEVFEFFKKQSFQLMHLKTCAGGLGCNEFVFQKK